MNKTLEIRSSPHIVSSASVDAIMFNVVLALLPTTAWAVYAFGLAALVTITTAVVSCVVIEHLLSVRASGATTVSDWSAVITGLLFGLVLPPGLPVWMTVVGSFIAIGLGKYLFGGLGFNVFNPALVGRAVLQATFPLPMTTWLDVNTSERFRELPVSTLTAPFTRPEAADVVSGATPLAQWKFADQLVDVRDLAFGMVNGSAGETSAILIIAGGLWLVARNMMNWRIPLAILATVAVCSAALHAIDSQAYAPPQFMLFSGGLMLGAVFMASDMVGSPMTNSGVVVYGVFIGVLIVAIRVWGGMPEGVMYAILLGNAITPHIDSWIQPRVYGTKRKPALRGAA